MDKAIAKEIKKVKTKEIKDKCTEGIVDSRTITNRTVIKIVEKHAKAKLVELGLQQLSNRLMIIFIRIFRQAFEQIHVGTWVPILDAPLGFNNRLGNMHMLNNK